MKLTPPTEGIYESTTPPGLRFIVSNVVHDTEDGHEFYALELVDEADAHDMAAIGSDLLHDEWLEMVDQYGLTYKGPHEG